MGGDQGVFRDFSAARLRYTAARYDAEARLNFTIATAEQVFKTLLTTDGSHNHVFAVVPGDSALDFKKLSRLAGWRKAEMAPLKEVQPLTGYIRGGVTIFGAKKPYPVFVDETAILFDRISVSAGTRGTQLILTPDDYLRAAVAIGQPVQTADLTKETKSSEEGRQ